ncbi:MAG TPA: hydantoinase/oxoprolinase family protein [Solirubrobacteraceae bacterium]|jgi:N-methylhydantoinase A|nr:hydantoinase/oxoprolinase family protein [Solirubrobacteraceae bacterium]
MLSAEGKVPFEHVTIGVDVGGTFTDLVLVGPDRVLNRVKLPSSPPNFADAIAAGIVRLLDGVGVGSSRVELLLHGTTVATNAILERRGARTALITTRGVRDVLELRRLRRPSLFDVQWDKPEPLVPRALRLEIDERMDGRGHVVRELDHGALRASVAELEDDGVEAVAVCLLNSHANELHERDVLRVIRDAHPSLYVSASYEISPEIGEYERSSSTVINAYLQPVVASYVDDLIRRAAELEIDAPIRIMKSNGGLASAEEAGRVPAAIVESGPAAGVTAAARLASTLGLRRVIAFDMGGTTAKASLIEDGRPFESAEYEVGSGISTSRILAGGGGYTLRFPSLDVAEVGAGGGSIVWLDALGTPHIGPESAGATPGPACYGRGGSRPTVTDANVVLGYLSSESLAGGAQDIYPDRAAEVIREQVAMPLRTDLLAAAHGIYLLANSLMARAIRGVTTERGRDPREYALVGYGGAGPMHAVQIARDFGMERVVIPPAPGVFSATGLLLAEMSYDAARSVWTTISGDDGHAVLDALGELESDVRGRAHAEGLTDDQLRIDRFADVRYAGQSFELRVSVPDATLSSNDIAAIGEVFHRDHERMYGHAQRDESVLIVNVRVRASDVSVTDAQRVAWLSDVAAASSTDRSQRSVYFGTGELLDTRVISRRDLRGTKLPGPLIIEDPDSTTVIPPSAYAEIGELGEILIETGA